MCYLQLQKFQIRDFCARSPYLQIQNWEKSPVLDSKKDSKFKSEILLSQMAVSFWNEHIGREIVISLVYLPMFSKSKCPEPPLKKSVGCLILVSYFRLEFSYDVNGKVRCTPPNNWVGALWLTEHG